MARASGLQRAFRFKWPQAMLLAALLVGAGRAHAGILEDKIEQSYPLSPSARITIRNAAGRIFVYGAKEHRLGVVAFRRAFTKERLEAIKISVSIEGDAAMIDTLYPPPAPGLFGDRSGTVDYVITVPQSCTLARVELGKGEVIIQGMRGEAIHAQLQSGLLHVRNCFSSSTLGLEEGRLDISYSWWERGAFALAARVASGDLILMVPPGAAFHFDGASERGKIRSAFGDLGDVRELRTTFGGENETSFEVRTVDGSIRLQRAY